MVPNEVKIGSRFYTRISSDTYTLCEVVEDTREGTKRYRLKRLDTGAILRALRGPGKLHTTPGPWHRAAETAKPAMKLASVAKAIAAKPGIAKIKTMSTPSQEELLRRLESMPTDTRLFLSDLLAAVTPPPAPVAKIPRHARG